MDYSLFASLYDNYVRTGLDIPFFLKETSRVTGEVLELMSGTGRVSLPLLESGIRLTCVDASPEMLQILQEKVSRRGLAADIHLMDIRELELGKKFERK